jgi:hypothetical protein
MANTTFNTSEDQKTSELWINSDQGSIGIVAQDQIDTFLVFKKPDGTIPLAISIQDDSTLLDANVISISNLIYKLNKL